MKPHPDKKPVQVETNVEDVVDPRRAADLYSRILRAVEGEEEDERRKREREADAGTAA
jgi:hypothetical protein